MDPRISAASEPTRREILHITAEREVTASEIAASFDITRPAVSQHLRALREAGLVTVRAEGTRRLYRANKDALADVLRSLAEFWSLKMLRLKSAAETKTTKGKNP